MQYGVQPTTEEIAALKARRVDLGKTFTGWQNSQDPLVKEANRKLKYVDRELVLAVDAPKERSRPFHAMEADRVLTELKSDYLAYISRPIVRAVSFAAPPATLRYGDGWY